ncbi:uncharacterized protein LOC122089031 [Macadamia integrifolia]|uniref:uncharacterized protein LOC122089031 n=1 Tax=Macadamia integrifolia TaxID=60698 RepID=UPI001C4FCC2C|nr:uncharacterized protein LOC122089031 [Macadamia integrifolia]
MESPLAGNLHSIQEKVIEELVQGRGLAAQLQVILHELTGFGRGSATAEDLVTRILRSFTEALSILSSNDSGKFPTSSPCWNHRRTSEEIPTSKDQSRKRAKIRNMQETWTRITSMPIEDGYAWRKYGQKGILNAKHLRCTYRFDQGCQATKQVQRTEDETPKFWTKYMGHHTCQDVLKASFILDSTAEEDELRRAAERRRRKRRLRIEPPLNSLRHTQPQQRPINPNPNPNAPKLPESVTVLTGNRLNLHNRILTLIRQNDLDEAALLTRHSIYSNCRPTIFTCNAVMAALLRQSRYSDLLSLHRFITQAGVAANVVTHNLLINAYCDCRKTDTALEHYKQLINDAPFNPSPTTYRILVKGLVDNNKVDRAVELKNEMLEKGFAPDSIVYNHLMLGLVKKLDPDGVLALYEELKEKLGGTHANKYYTKPLRNAGIRHVGFASMTLCESPEWKLDIGYWILDIGYWRLNEPQREREKEALMESALAGNLASVREKVIGELVQGREFAAQLQLVLHDLTGSGHDSATAKDLVTKVLRSFTEALTILSYTESGQVPVSSSSRDQQPRKQSKKRNMQETWTRITSMPIEDGYAWRKYGQKEILNAKHLRCYYRCTYRFDQGCQATKQVQRTEDETPKFWTKYSGHHTCQDVLNQASFILDSTAEEGVLLNFGSNTTTKQEPFFFSSSFPSRKEEPKKSFPSIQQEYNPSSSDYFPSQDLIKCKSSMPTSTLNSDHGDAVSGSSSSSSSSSSFDLDMELIDSVNLNDVLFDEEFF